VAPSAPAARSEAEAAGDCRHLRLRRLLRSRRDPLRKAPCIGQRMTTFSDIDCLCSCSSACPSIVASFSCDRCRDRIRSCDMSAEGIAKSSMCCTEPIVEVPELTGRCRVDRRGQGSVMRSQRWVLYAALVTVYGCAGDGEGLDENGRPISEEDSGGELTATFESIQDTVLTPICTTCHTGASAPLGLRLDEGASYALLVNAPSAEVEGVLRVDPGNPDDSYLIRKLEGTAEVGGRMPLNAPALPASTIAIIRQWIVEGAQAPASDA